GPGVRVDDGIQSGTQVSPYYDAMLAKIITWGADRPEAIRKMVQALQDTVVLGVTTNLSYLLAILEHPDFQAGRTSTAFLEQHFADWQPQPDNSRSTWLAIAALEALRGGDGSRAATTQESVTQPDPWNETGRWRNV